MITSSIKSSAKFVYSNAISVAQFLNNDIIVRISKIFSFVINKISFVFSKAPPDVTEKYSIRGNGFARSKEYQNLIDQMKSRKSNNNFHSKNLYTYIVYNKNI